MTQLQEFVIMITHTKCSFTLSRVVGGMTVVSIKNGTKDDCNFHFDEQDNIISIN
jgi:hypothetical protein